jgi:hypothetical protein
MEGGISQTSQSNGSSPCAIHVMNLSIDEEYTQWGQLTESSRCLALIQSKASLFQKNQKLSSNI